MLIEVDELCRSNQVCKYDRAKHLVLKRMETSVSVFFLDAFIAHKTLTAYSLPSYLLLHPIFPKPTVCRPDGDAERPGREGIQ